MGESLLAQGVSAYRMPDVEKVRELVVSGIPLQRPARPEDVAYAALYLACDESSLVTGLNLLVDGGAHA
jgi:NAD(P)-dependent dehydrogenase (short-subunit alcohol dehydrogenase family)